jgi:hypothetical protein
MLIAAIHYTLRTEMEVSETIPLFGGKNYRYSAKVIFQIYPIVFFIFICIYFLINTSAGYLTQFADLYIKGF